MITRRGSLTGITMRGGLGTLTRFAVDWSRIETVVAPGDTEEQTIDDAVFEVSTPATVDYEAQAILRPTHPDADVSQITWSTSDPAIATIDQSGRVTRIADGYIRIIATDQHGATARSGLVHIYRESGVESQTFVRWVEGSLAKAAADAIDSRIADADPQTDMAIFTTQDHANGIYVRNPDCWAADLDLTGISPWNSRSGALRAGVAISPRDVLVSEHYPLQVGNTIRFVDGDNNTITRTIAAVKNVGPANSSDGYATDFQVCTLSEDLPAEIKHYSVLPAGWADYIRTLNIGLPTMGLDQQEKALVQDLYSLGTFAAHRAPSDSQRLAFYESKITGDSGNPSLLILDDEPVLVTLWTFGGAGSGPNIARLHDAINAAMTANGSPYQLTVADLSGWPNYALSPSEAFIELMKSYDWNGYWPLNETSGSIAYDHSGNDRHGTILANVGVADIDSVFGDGSKAMRFTQMMQDCHIVLPNIPQFNSLTQLTVMAVVRANSFHNTNAIISNARDCCGTYNGWDLWLNRYEPSQPRPALTQWNNGTLNVNQPGTNYTLEANRWYHIAATYDGSITKVYIDGVLAFTSSPSADRIGTPATFPTKIGKMGQSSTLGLDGWASHVAIKGSALSDTDIATIASAALAGVTP